MILWILQFIIAILLGIFVNFPAPELTDNLKSWKKSGKYFTFKNHEVFYKDETAKGKDTLICLHGFPSSSYDWSKISDGLNAQFERVIYLDFLGLGLSDKPYNYEYKVGEQADIVESLLRKLKVKAVHILSHDFGDTVAQELLARQIQHGEHYDFNYISLCMLNGGIFPDHYHPLLMQKLLLLPFFNFIIPRLGTSYGFKMSMNAVFGPNTQLEEKDAKEFYALHRFNDGNLVISSILKYLNERQQNKYRWVGALQNTKIPVHFIYGPTDPINKNPEFPDHYRKTLPQHSLDVIEGNQIGHYPQWEAPDRVIHSYRKFLKQITTNY